MKRAARQFDLHRFTLAAISALVLVLAFTGAVFAQDGQADPPGRAARLAVAEGSVTLQPAGMDAGQGAQASTDWVAAEVNRPLTIDDRLWVDAGSRAEIDAGTAVIRLGAATGFSFVNLDDRAVQMRLAAGTAIIHVRQLLEEQTYEIDTPNLAVTLRRPGTYRIEVNRAGDTTTVKVVDGDALAANATQNFPVARGQEAIFTGFDQLTCRYVSPGQADALEVWSMQRDATYQDSDSRRYVAEDIPGAQDLDSYGEWEDTPEYGYVWTPSDVAADWAPYSTGTWTWVAPWGWTWVDGAIWGYAPFHYGRWANWRGRWRWVPGPHQGRACYAPALVAWAGGEPGVAAWFALGPREPYIPSYHVSAGYLARVNAGALYSPGRVPGRYVNAGIAGAVTAVPHDTFIGGRPIRGPERLSSGRFTLGAVSATPPPIAPIRQSVLGNGRPAFHPASAVLNRPVVARMTPPAPSASFERQRAAVVANGNRALEPAQLQQLSGRAPAERPLPPTGAGAFVPRPEPRPQTPPAAPVSAQRPLPQPAVPRSTVEPRPFTPPEPPTQMSPRIAPAPQMPHPVAPPPPAPAPHAAPAPPPHADNSRSGSHP